MTPPREPELALSSFKAMLVDVDGTLLDSNAAHAAAWAQALTEAGLPHDAETIRPLIGMGSDKLLPRVSIFMSVFNCHINRSPATGRVEKILYQPGKFLNADLDKASADNERNSLVISTSGGSVGVVQIAGLVARRIVPFVKPGDMLASGQRVGLIRFGSRVDVYLPKGTSSRVLLGQKTIAGETILGEIGHQEVLEGVSQ